MINKGTDKQYAAVFLLHNTTHHYQALKREIFDRKNVHMYYIYMSERM